MNENLREKSVELLKELAESVIQALLWIINGIVAFLELAIRWLVHFVVKTYRWLVDEGIPMAISVATTLIDVSFITIQGISVAAISVGRSIGDSLQKVGSRVRTYLENR